MLRASWDHSTSRYCRSSGVSIVRVVQCLHTNWISDQFYTARENTPKRYLSEHGASYPDSGVVMVSSDPATADSIRFLAPSPLLDISLVVYNIIIDD